MQHPIRVQVTADTSSEQTIGVGKCQLRRILQTTLAAPI